MMKHNSSLFPSLGQIEQRLFGLDTDLLQRVALDDPTLPGSFRLAVKDDPQHAQALQALRDMAAEDAPGPSSFSADPAPAPMPSWLVDTIRRKAATSALALPQKPETGLLVEVAHVITPPGAPLLDWQLNSPLHVLLDEPSPDNDQVWLGWMVSPDADYAGWWDVVLEPSDGPLDPACGMVQLWNPVQLYWPMARRLCGQIPATRMQVLRACAEEMLFSDSDPEGMPRPGRIGLRSIPSMPGISILCGSPLGQANDPRLSYQAMYHQVSAALLEPARLASAQPASVQNSVLARYWQQCLDWGRDLGHRVLPQAPVSLALGEQNTSAYCFVFDDALRLTLSQEDTQMCAQLQNIHPTEPLRIEHLMDQEVQERTILAPGQSHDLRFDPEQAQALRWRAESASQWTRPLQLQL